MRAVVTRVGSAAVRVEGEEVASVGPGLLVLLGVAADDEEEDAARLAGKVRHLRIFGDEHRPLNRSVEDTGGEVLVVSQFTLLADTSRGRRPSFLNAARPGRAERLYRSFVDALSGAGLRVRQGTFGASMQVESTNDGPVTIILSTREGDRL